MLGKIISAKAGLTLLKMAVEKTIGKKVFDYEVIYKIAEKQIWFRIWEKENENPKMARYQNPETLTKVFDMKLHDNKIEKELLEIVTLRFSENSFVVYKNENGNKLKQTYKL